MIDNRPLAGGTHLLRLAFAEASARAPVSQPGQFVQMLAAPSLHLVRRPMSIHDEGDGWRTFLVKPVGPASRELTALAPGAAVDAGPPLGHGFPPARELAQRARDGGAPLLLVGGGFGIAPLHFLARRLDALGGEPGYTILYGGRTARDIEDAALDGVRGRVLESTDDGTRGFHGTCVTLAEEELRRAGDRARDAVVLTCGSQAMMAALASALRGRIGQLYVSLEEIMACGVGVCMGCVTPSRHGYVPICTTGPVFPAEEVFGFESEASAHA